MRHRRVTRIPLFVVIVLCSVFASVPGVSAREYTIAVVRDGEGNVVDAGASVQYELERLIEQGRTVTFKSGPAFTGNWDKASVRQALVNALTDAEVDFVLVVGRLGIQESERSGMDLPKPVVHALERYAGVFEADPRAVRTTGANPLPIFLPYTAERDVSTFLQVMPFDTLLVAIDEAYVRHLEHLRQGIKELGDSLGIHIDLLPVGTDVTGVVSAIDPSVDAVMLADLLRLDDRQRTQLITQMNERRLLTFTILGDSDVARGVLASDAPNVSALVARRAALSLSQLIRGEPIESLPVLLSAEQKLVINGRTAAAIGYSPSLEARVTAEFLHPEALESVATKLAFRDALLQAETGNTSLKIRDAELETARRERQLSLSPLLPQVNLDASRVDWQKPNSPVFDVIPDNATRAGFKATQMIYDDALVSARRSQNRLYDAAKYDREAARLDIVAQAGDAFLSYVVRRVLYRVELANVALTKENLALSKIRFETGYSGRDEVFRWQAEVAQQQAGLFYSAADVEAARLSLNQILGIDQGTRWDPEEIDVDPDVFPFLGGRVDQFIRDTRAVDRLREFAVLFAFENAPELKALDLAVQSEGIQVGQRKRRWIIPVFDASVDWNYFIDQTPPIIGNDKVLWNFRLSASYPLFLGLGKVYDVGRSQAIKLALERDLEFNGELVEQRTRTASRRVENAFPTIRFTQIAADNAKRNLEIVQEKYAGGIVNVTDLLEAQNQGFTAEQQAVAAVYTFLFELVEFQRSLSWFEDEQTPAAVDSVYTRLEAFVERR